MARYKTYDYRQRVLLPVSLEDQLMPATLEFAIHTLVEKRLDMSIFAGKYRNDETGRAAYDPKTLLKVVLLAYSQGLISSRKIKQACRENVVFVALAYGQHPDHSTIAAFVSSMRDEILPLFRDVLLVCEEMNLLGGTMFALDGCKLPSNASKEWSGTLAELRKKEEKIEAKVAQLLEEQVQANRGQDDPPGPEGSGSRRQQQVEKLQKKAEQIGQQLTENQPKIGAVLRPRCIYAAGAKRKILLVPFDESLSRQMVEKIDTPVGHRIYPQRLAIADPVFANIRINKRLDRFTLRGKIKVNIQWLMYCLVHNIEKILNYGLAYA